MTNEQLTAASLLAVEAAVDGTDNLNDAATLLLCAAWDLVASIHGKEKANSWLLNQALLAPGTDHDTAH
ncbi:MAG TPA: hypothetical protein DCM00_17005 [Alcanivorax sp.]|jgi:hypothetical protein|uniref:hypothetical protein n=1 Tax=Alloalcanivorax venustensis TaxID=172371 RepID=UPI000EDFC017|nr:hypothetical protein [Alcanivorax sp.]